MATERISFLARDSDEGCKLGDGVKLYVGDGADGADNNVGDVSIGWDGTDLDILVAADDSVIKVGNGTLSADVWVYGNTASDYLLWDASASTLSTVGAATISLAGGLTLATTGLTLTDVNVVLSATTGTKIGTATTQKLGFFNATPIVQPAAIVQTFATADRTHAARTAVALTDNSAGTANTTIQALADGSTYANDVAAIRNNFADLAAAVNAVIVDLADTASLLNSVVDDHQALGLAG